MTNIEEYDALLGNLRKNGFAVEADKIHGDLFKILGCGLRVFFTDSHAKTCVMTPQIAGSWFVSIRKPDGSKAIFQGKSAAIYNKKGRIIKKIGGQGNGLSNNKNRQQKGDVRRSLREIS